MLHVDVMIVIYLRSTFEDLDDTGSIVTAADGYHLDSRGPDLVYAGEVTCRFAGLEGKCMSRKLMRSLAWIAVMGYSASCNQGCTVVKLYLCVSRYYLVSGTGKDSTRGQVIVGEDFPRTRADIIPVTRRCA